MFGQPHWFRRKRIGWGLVPICWQGWVYALVWTAVILLPFGLMLLRHQPIESVIWMIVSMGALVWDVRRTIQAMDRREQQDLLHIGDDDSDSHLTTRSFDLRLRS